MNETMTMTQTDVPQAASEHGLLGDKLAWDGRQLVLRDRSIADTKLRRKALSPSTAKAFSSKSCVSRWVAEKLMPPAPEDHFDPAPLGTGAHAVLEDLYKLPAEMRTLNAFEMLLENQTNQLFPIEDGAPDAEVALARMNRRNWKAEARTRSETIFTMEDPTKVHVLGCETKLDGAMIKGVPTTGFIDRLDTDRPVDAQIGQVDADTDYPILIRDYKTGEAKVSRQHLRYGDDHGDQMRIYALALKNLTGKMPAAAALYYTNGNITAKSKGPAVREVDLSQAALDKTEAEFVRAWARHNKLMDSGKFPVKVSALCGWCPLVASCPAAQSEGKEARKEGLPTAEELGVKSLESLAEAHETGAPSAHMGEETGPVETDPTTVPEPGEGEKKMAYDDQDDKPWVYRRPDGGMNPSSYAMTAGFGLSSMAVEAIHKAGRPLKVSEVKAVTGMFAAVTGAAQKRWVGVEDLMSHSHTRMRGALHTVLELDPAPLDGTTEQIKGWMNQAVKRITLIAQSAEEVADYEYDKAPWTVLASDAEDQVEAETDPDDGDDSAAEQQEPVETGDLQSADDYDFDDHDFPDYDHD